MNKLPQRDKTQGRSKEKYFKNMHMTDKYRQDLET